MDRNPWSKRAGKWLQFESFVFVAERKASLEPRLPYHVSPTLLGRHCLEIPDEKYWLSTQTGAYSLSLRDSLPI